MNAPFHGRVVEGENNLTAFAFFHLNLAFSSIEEERRGEVIAHCYHPLLDLCERRGPIGVELSGYTLEEIAARDPGWIVRARALIAAGRIELIGSGYSQLIGPLVPARVTRENLRLGHAVYERLLGTSPRVALVNEQAYAGGLVALYRETGYDAILMDWENAAANHPEWPEATQYLPQYAVGPDGTRIALLWSNTTLFQQLQRLAHGDTEADAYLAFVRRKRIAAARALCLYASDAEIFDFRPGRFRTEEHLSERREWARIAAAFAALADGGIALAAPSAILALLEAPGAGRALVLESAACPVPVKKQRKYNLARWAVTGRDDTAINAACERIYRGLLEGGASASTAKKESGWKELCYLWSSDFRTHITEKRWTAYCARLKAAEACWASAPPPQPVPLTAPPQEQRHIDVATPQLKACLDRRRGLAIQSLHFANQAQPSLGGLPHGFFEDIALAADWYTGDSVFEAPGEHKVTDLEWCEARLKTEKDGAVLAEARVETPKGLIEKRLRFCADAPRVEFDLAFHWSAWGKGVLRLGHFTLLPEAFDIEKLSLATTNGGSRETFALAGARIDHGAPVSFLVSSSHGFGMTEGWAEIGDGKTGLRIEVDRATAPLLGMLSHRPLESRGGAKSLFCQIQLSALELDDTSKPGVYREGPRRFRFSVSAI